MKFTLMNIDCYSRMQQQLEDVINILNTINILCKTGIHFHLKNPADIIFMNQPLHFIPCPCHPQSYETNFRRRSSTEPRGDHRRFEMPVVKKYLPMYQSPELIEELKRHDRMKLIREREARRRRAAGSPRSPDSISVSSAKGHQRTDRIVVCHPPKPVSTETITERVPPSKL